MKFTTATNPIAENIKIVVINDALYVSYSANHPNVNEIKNELIDSGYIINQHKGQSYTATGGSQSELEQIKADLDASYCLNVLE